MSALSSHPGSSTSSSEFVIDIRLEASSAECYDDEAGASKVGRLREGSYREDVNAGSTRLT